MKKGKLYTVLGVDGVVISRSNGVYLEYDNDSIDMSDKIDFADLEDEVIRDIADDIDMFVDNGYEFLAEVVLDDDTGSFIATDIVYKGYADEFDDVVIVNNNDYYKNEEEDELEGEDTDEEPEAAE